MSERPDFLEEARNVMRIVDAPHDEARLHWLEAKLALVFSRGVQEGIDRVDRALVSKRSMLRRADGENAPYIADATERHAAAFERLSAAMQEETP
jgi:hypothetical protein